MGCSRGEIGSQAWRRPRATQEGQQVTVKKLAFLLALVACVVPMTLIRSDDTAAAGHNARDQTPVTRPAQQQREPIILRPSDSQQKGPFRLPEFVPDKGFVNERTAHRQPGGAISD